MTGTTVRSRRTIIWGTGPLPDLLRARTRPAEDDHEPLQTDDGLLADLVVVLDPGTFVPVSPSRAIERRAQLLTDLSLFLDSFLAELGRVVIVTSAAVLGAAPDQEAHDDDAVLCDVVDGTVGDLVCAEREILERLTAHAGREGHKPDVAIVRTAALVGPGIDTMITRHFEAPRLLTVRGPARSWQFIHVEDVASAVGVVLTQGLVGAVNAGSEGEMAAADVVAASGIRAIELPAAKAFAMAERLHRVGVLPAPASDLAYTIYPWTVTSARLRDAGWRPIFTNAQCLEVLLGEVRGRVGVAGRRMGGRDAAALGAAGAAVAVIGTAAIWRQVRGR